MSSNSTATAHSPPAEVPTNKPRSNATSEGSGENAPATKARSNAISKGSEETAPANKLRSNAISKGSEEKTTRSGPEEDTKPEGSKEVKKPQLAAAEDKKSAATTKIPELQHPQYAIETYLWKAEGFEATGAILSQSLKKSLDQQPGKYAGDLSLAFMRKIIPGMSSFSRLHKFCTASGVIVTDESRSLEDYLSLDLVHGSTQHEAETNLAPDRMEAAKTTAGSEPVAAKPKVARLNIFFRSPVQVATAGAGQVNLAPQLDSTPRAWGGASGAVGGGGGGYDANGNPLSSNAPFQAPEAKGVIKDDATLGPNAATSSYTVKPIAATMTAGNLMETEWSVVLRNCAVMYGWKVDLVSGRVIRAPRPAFQLRSRIHEEPTTKLPMFVAGEDDLRRLKVDAEEAEWERSLFEAGGMTDADFKRLEATEKARSAAAEDNTLVTTVPNIPPLVNATNQPSELVTKTDFGIPNFRVNDDSIIDIHACTSSFATSLAKSDFSSESIEASLNAGAYGVQVGASMGASKDENSFNAKKEGHSMQKVVARYMFPRCDIFLRPEDLEPTPEFAALLEVVRTEKSIDAVRKIHDRYGQLFCQELTLGGRLLSTKIITSNSSEDLESKKEQFKVSVGANVQSPYGGGGVKASKEKGESTEQATNKASSEEDNIFEAVGGDTILANNPSAWSSTVAYPSLWRVINRQGLLPLMEMLSEMPKYAAVQKWFALAVPALCKYVALDEQGAINARLKIESPQNSLHIENNGRTVYYLGFDPVAAVTPYQHYLSTQETDNPDFWQRSTSQTTNVLFSPATYRSPTIYGYRDGMVGDGPYGSSYDKAFTQTQWKIISPFVEDIAGRSNREFRHDARVIMQSVPLQVPAQEGKPDATPPPSHMVVFRNGEGQFVPGMSDRGEFQYWRIQKVSDRPVQAGAPLKSGDTVRLVWKFADQQTGFRDFVEDSFGRRRIQCPPELESTTLYLKVPWPRFELKDVPTALIMSCQSSADNVLENIATKRGVFTYALQDLKMRLDTVGERGRGDSSDYMLAGFDQKHDETRETSRVIEFHPPRNPPGAIKLLAFMDVIGLGIVSGFARIF